jgi:hypothetical protein
VKQFVTGEKVSEWTANKTLPAQRLHWNGLSLQ